MSLSPETCPHCGATRDGTFYGNGRASDRYRRGSRLYRNRYAILGRRRLKRTVRCCQRVIDRQAKALAAAQA